MNQAYQLEAARTLRCVDRPRPGKAEPGWVWLKVMAVGICGSDLEYYRHGRCGGFIPQTPLVLGHEFSGEVVALGEGVDNLHLGDAVAVDPSFPCQRCHYCRSGRYHLCPQMKFLGSASCSPHLDGGFAHYVTLPATNCLAFCPQQLSWQQAALVEPLMVALAAASKIDRIVQRRIVVFGGGTIGQLILASLRMMGSLNLALVDPRTTARERASRWQAEALTPEEVAGRSFDTCVEVSGHPQALASCYRCAARGGLIVQVGTLADDVTLPVNVVMSKELTVRGSFRYSHLFSTALSVLTEKRLVLGHLISHTLPLSQVEHGLEIALDPTVDSLKIQLIADQRAADPQLSESAKNARETAA